MISETKITVETPYNKYTDLRKVYTEWRIKSFMLFLNPL